MPGTLPFSCPLNATKASKERQNAAQSETEKSRDFSGVDARYSSTPLAGYCGTVSFIVVSDADRGMTAWHDAGVSPYLASCRPIEPTHVLVSD